MDRQITMEEAISSVQATVNKLDRDCPLSPESLSKADQLSSAFFDDFKYIDKNDAGQLGDISVLLASIIKTIYTAENPGQVDTIAHILLKVFIEKYELAKGTSA